MKASHKKTKTMVGLRVVELEPGQFVFGLKVASKDLKIPQTTIYRHLKFLKSVGNMEIKAENKFSIITIINWGAYQDTKNENGKQMENKLKTNGNIQELKALKEKKKKSVPPKMDDVIKFFLDNNYTRESAIKAWRYYDDGDWKDSTGKPVLNWKQKMRGVWFKSENESKTVYKTPEETPTPDYLKDFVANIGKKPKEV